MILLRVSMNMVDESVRVERITGIITAEALAEASIDRATVYILTDPDEATSIPLAREKNEALQILVYADHSTPDFASHIADLILDPKLFPPESVIAEIVK